MLHLILSTGILIALFYYYAIKPMSYWKNRGVIQGKPMWLLGDKWKHFFRLENICEMIQRAYNIAPGARFAGFYEFNIPTLVVKDPALLKLIAIKDFEHFLDHVPIIPEGADPLWSNNLFALKDEKWRETRSILSPCFSSGKIKTMYAIMAKCAENLIEHFLQKEENEIDVTMKDIASRFANDIIASAAFGLQVDSLKNPNNEFYTSAKMIVDFSIRKSIKLFGFLAAPKLLKLFKIKLFDPITRKFFIDMIDDTVKARREQSIVRQDMIHLLLEVMEETKSNKERDAINNAITNSSQKKKLKKQKITNENITAHAMIFFFAGLDSVSTTICFMAYELATDPEIQNKLRIEIDEGFERCNGKLTYDVLMQMKYLNMVVSETLRKWPNFVFIDRLCTKEYVIEPTKPGERAITIEKGTHLMFPVYPLHYDEKYFPNPERFDPQRFDDKNKIDSYPYYPFGLGPRHCIASRFALLEIKVFFAHLIYHFELIPISKTQIPIKLSKASFNLGTEDGIYLGLKRLNK